MGLIIIVTLIMAKLMIYSFLVNVTDDINTTYRWQHDEYHYDDKKITALLNFYISH